MCLIREMIKIGVPTARPTLNSCKAIKIISFLSQESPKSDIHLFNSLSNILFQITIVIKCLVSVLQKLKAPSLPNVESAIKKTLWLSLKERQNQPASAIHTRCLMPSETQSQRNASFKISKPSFYIYNVYNIAAFI